MAASRSGQTGAAAGETRRARKEFMPFSIFRKKESRPEAMLPAGWQFYSRPTNLEPPGTIFRIDGEGRRFIVERLKPVVERGSEPGAARTQCVETKVSFLARVLGLDASADAAANRVKAFQFELTNPERESTTDVEIDKVLRPFLSTMEFRAENRYFVIRETRSVTAMKFLLTDEQLGEIGGKGVVGAAGALELQASAECAGYSELAQAFPERLGVMFLPEEIAPVKAGLGGRGEVELGRLPVKAPLDWVEPDYAVVQVFYATDRRPTGLDNPAEKYGAERGEMTYGQCEVSIPRDHRMGDLEAPSIWKLDFRKDPAKHVVLLRLDAQPKELFFGELAARVRASASRNAFLFMHGYNVTFEDAARRTAQISYDLGFDGAPVLYSWPSQGSLVGYTVDEANIEWSQTNLKEFLVDFFARSEAQQLYLIAHSMGNRAMARAVAAFLAEHPGLKERLAEVILTAPDIDADVFRREIAPALAASGRPVTLYASSSDTALAASKKVHGSPRAGEAGAKLVVVKGIETIDATGMDTSLLGHSYFAETRSVLSDIFSLVRHGQRPDARFGLRAIDTPAGRHWAFKG